MSAYDECVTKLCKTLAADCDNNTIINNPNIQIQTQFFGFGI